MKVIQRLRQEKGLSRSRLAIMAGVNLTVLYEFEAGRRVPYPKAARKLAEALQWGDDPMRLFEEVN